MKEATGKLAVMSVGLGAVMTTFITGTLMYRKGLTVPDGSVIEMAKNTYYDFQRCLYA